MRALFFGLVIVTWGCSKTPNPEVCCTDRADCSSIGAAEEVRTCPDGLACISHECVIAECSTQGCMPQAPVCNVATNICEGCTGNPDCANIPDQQRCNLETGSCVQCLVASDCGSTAPVCDGNRCRKCERDSECPTGACGENGSCLVEQQLVYLSPAGTDSGSCTSTQPCRSIPFAVSKTSVQRSHIVMQFGSYSASQIQITASDTTASPLVFHGGGSVLTASSGDGGLLTLTLPTTIRDLEIDSNMGYALAVGPDPTLLERVKVRGSTSAILASGSVTIRDFEIEDRMQVGAYGIQMGIGTLTLERGVLGGGIPRSCLRRDRSSTSRTSSSTAPGCCHSTLRMRPGTFDSRRSLTRERMRAPAREPSGAGTA